MQVKEVEMGIDKNELLKLMQSNWEKSKGVKLDLDIKDYPAVETIVVPHANIPKKKNYINKTYDNELNHIHSDGVRIIGIQL
jgi:hypothetical protein